MDIQKIPVSKIVPNPFQARETFTPEQIEELALSIEQRGLQQPITVRPSGSKFEIVDGERRWRALRSLEWKEIDVIVEELSDKAVKEAAYISNAQREDLLPFERENAIFALWNTGEYESYRDLDKKLGYKSSTVKTLLDSREYRLKAKLPDDIDTFTIKSTRGLDDDIRMRVIDKVGAGDITKRDSYKYAGRLKKMPKVMQTAIVSDKIDIDDAEPLIDAGLSEELLEPAIEELTDRKEGRDKIRKLQTEADVSIVKGELEAKGVRYEISSDEKRLRKFETVRDQIRWWGTTTLMQIENENFRNKAVDYVRDIELFCGQLLEQLAKEVDKD